MQLEQNKQGVKSVNFKRFTAALLTFVMCAMLFTGCGKNYEKVVTVDGFDFTPTMYLCAQYQSYNAAWTMVDEDVEDIFGETIEEVSAMEWIHNQTIKNLQTYVWVEKTFEEMGLKLAEEDVEYIEYQVEYYWSYYESYYMDNGIGRDTYQQFVELDYKYDMIFEALYGEGGEKEPSDAECIKYMNDTYVRIKGFELSKLDREGEELIDKDMDKIEGYAKDAVEKLNGGAELNDVCAEIKTLAADWIGDETDYSKGEDHVVDSYVGEESTAFSEEVSDKAFALKENSEFVYGETEDSFVIFQRIPNFVDDTELKSIKSDLVTEMMGTVFAEEVEAAAAEYEVVEDAAAVKYYSAKNII